MPKSSKTIAPIEVTFTPEAVHEAFATEQISRRWEEGVTYLYKTYTVEKYLLIIRNEPAGEKKVAEFAALVEYVASIGYFYLQEHHFSDAINHVASRYRREQTEAILKQQDWTSFNPTEGFCLACIPHVTAIPLQLISNYIAGCDAFTHYLHKEPNRHEGMRTTAEYYINLKAPRISVCHSEARTTAERNNYDLWLREPLSRRIHVGCSSSEVWDIGETTFQRTSLHVLELVDALRSKTQLKEEDEIKDLKKPKDQDLEDAEDTDNRTLVDF